MFDIENLTLGNEYRLYYPSRNRVTRPPKFEPREFVLWRIRDLWHEPLTPDEFMKRPTVSRGRWLLVGREPKNDMRFRQYYLACTKEHWRPSVLRVGVFDPKQRQSKPVRVLDHAFGWSADEQYQLARFLARWRHATFSGLELRVFCDGLKVRRAG